MTTGRINQVSRRDKQEPAQEELTLDPSQQSKYTERRRRNLKVALGLPDNKQFSYPYKYNRSATRVLFTRRVKPTQKQ